MRKIGWQIAVLLVGFVLSLTVIGVFSVRAMRHASFRRVDESIRPWMTLPYIAHSYHVPAQDLYKALGVNPILHDRRTVMKLSSQLKMPLAEVETKLNQAIVQARPTAPAPTSQPPPPTP